MLLAVRVDTGVVQHERTQGTRQLLACAACRHRLLRERACGLTFDDAAHVLY